MTVDETATAAHGDRFVGSSEQYSRLAECLGGGQVRVHGMPVVSLWDGRVVGVEVLARWHTPDGRVLLPTSPRVGCTWS